MMAVMDPRVVCRTMVGLLALAHDAGCEADLACRLDHDLDQGRLPDLADLRAAFTPTPGAVPEVTVTLPAAADYDVLLLGRAQSPRRGRPWLVVNSSAWWWR